jgi:hypothetical protein
MPAQQNNKKLTDRKEWQMMTPSPNASSTGSLIITEDYYGLGEYALLVVSSALQYLYSFAEDSWVSLPSASLAGTFGAGACGSVGRWSNVITATGGSTTTATIAINPTAAVKGKTIRFITGANSGLDATVTSINYVPGGTSTLKFSTLPFAVANNDTFVLDTQVFYVMSAGTLATGSFKSYDVFTSTWTNLAIAGLPATWGTDARMVATPSAHIYSSGAVTSSTSTVVTTGKTWTANQWTNYQLRITAGTGIGQVRAITSNTTNTVSVGPTFSVTPDATSVFAIECNDNNIYLFGNSSGTTYRYSKSANSWITLAPTVARGGSFSTGGTANLATKTDDVEWSNETDIKDGRYIYSFRGGGSATLDRFDIAGGTAGAGAWAIVTYGSAGETFTTGSSVAYFGDGLFVRKDSTHRFFKYSVVQNILVPISTNMYADGAAVIGSKVIARTYDSGRQVTWLYSFGNSLTTLHRVMLI